MRPNGEEVLRGVQSSLLTYILPELQSQYARTELMIIHTLLGVVANEIDGAAQRLVDDNAALRALARRGADETGDDELRALANERDGSLALSDLTKSRERLHAALTQLATASMDASLRGDIVRHLRDHAEARSLHLMGQRADG